MAIKLCGMFEPETGLPNRCKHCGAPRWAHWYYYSQKLESLDASRGVEELFLEPAGDLGPPPLEERAGPDARGLELKSTNPKDKIGIKKVPLSLVPSTALVYQAMAHKNGAIKYGPYNWRKEGVSAWVYIDACLRHVRSWYDGEELAQDSGVHHLGHAIACLNIILDAMACGTLVDDRPTPGPTAKLLEEFKE